MSTDRSVGGAPSSPPPSLPHDVPTLHALIRELLDALQKEQRECDGLRHRLDQLLRRLYGPKAERFDPNQPWLLPELAEPAPPEPPPAALPGDTDSPAKPKRPGHGRRQLPADLPRQREEYTL